MVRGLTALANGRLQQCGKYCVANGCEDKGPKFSHYEDVPKEECPRPGHSKKLCCEDVRTHYLLVESRRENERSSLSDQAGARKQQDCKGP